MRVSGVPIAPAAGRRDAGPPGLPVVALAPVPAVCGAAADAGPLVLDALLPGRTGGNRGEAAVEGCGVLGREPPPDRLAPAGLGLLADAGAGETFFADSRAATAAASANREPAATGPSNKGASCC
jgi:hypothetical protein